MSIQVHLPINNLKDPFFRHAGDTFRELAELWETAGFVEIVLSDNGYVWIGGEPNTPEGILLYDRPTSEWWKRAPPSQYKMALFGNDVPARTVIPRAFPWIFWARRPRHLEELAVQGRRLISDRPVSCVFIGKIENQVQQAYRDANKWSAVVEHFKLVVGLKTPYPYSQQEYLNQLGQAKFGLCLRGYGPKCNREIELMGLGTVPIITPGVDMKGYFDPPKEGVHYLIANTPLDVPRLIAEISDAKWDQMSRACFDWYMRNASVRGSFYQTMRAIETITSTALIQPPRPITLGFSAPRMKLPGFKRLVVDTVFFERQFSGISRVWTTILSWLSALREYSVLTDAERRSGFSDIEIVLLLRQRAQIPEGILQRYSFVGNVTTFNYNAADEDVEYLDNICSQLDADLFVSTYYTHCTKVPNLLLIHDMIPERFQFPIDSMWLQKTKSIANAHQVVCVSESTAADFKKYAPNAPATLANRIVVAHNSFDGSVFSHVERDATKARQTLATELRIPQSFILVIAGNGNGYKNVDLVIRALRKRPEAWGSHYVVFIGSVQLTPRPRFRVLRSVTDRQLGMLYAAASATIYPSRYEGFGLPILEAFAFQCPIICCKDAGGVTEVAGDGAWLVHPDSADELCNAIESCLTDANEREHKRVAGLKQIERFSVPRQIQAWRACIQDQFKNLRSVTPTQVMSETTETTTAATTQPEQPAAEAPQPPPADSVHMIVQYFNCPDSERQDEFDYCVKANLANDQVAKLHCLIEPNTKVPEWLSGHKKYVEFQVLNRLTYKTAIEYANTFLGGRTIALANLDIFLDHTVNWSAVDGLLDKSIVLCIARHEFDGQKSTKDKNLQNLAYATAQDCWVFRAPIFVRDCDFAMGRLGCDNAIAQRLRASGYLPINAQDDFKIHHLDVCRGKDGSNFPRHHEANPDRPEERGYRLLPNFNSIQSVDKLIEGLKLGEVNRYLIICDIMSNFMRLTNEPPKPAQEAASTATEETAKNTDANELD